MFELASRLVGVYKVNHMVSPFYRNVESSRLIINRPGASPWRIKIILYGVDIEGNRRGGRTGRRT